MDIKTYISAASADADPQLRRPSVQDAKSSAGERESRRGYSNPSSQSQTSPAILQQTPYNLSEDAKLKKFDLAIALQLAKWAPLTAAVQSNWGGEGSSTKRDWLAGAISDLFAQEALEDQEDLEVVLLQVMEDEFDVRVEDDSEVDTAEGIFRLREQIMEGDFAAVDRLYESWEERNRNGRLKETINVREIENAVDSGEETGSEDQTQGDTDMLDAPQPASVKEQKEPEVDEEGFTRVVNKKRR